MGVPICETALCRERNAETLVYFDFYLSVTDHTGTILINRLPWAQL